MSTNKESVNQRFLDAVEDLKITGRIKNIADFCRKSGISPYSIRDIRNNRQNVTNEMVRKIWEAFKINADWILLGNGPMFDQGNIDKNEILGDSSVNERFNLIIKELDKNPNSFAKAIGTSSSVVYNIIGGKLNQPSCDILEKIIITFNIVNIEWLISGKGNMFKSAGDGASSTEIMELKHRIQILEAEKEALFEKATLLKDTTTVYEKMLKIIERDQGKNEQRQAG